MPPLHNFLRIGLCLATLSSGPHPAAAAAASPLSDALSPIFVLEQAEALRRLQTLDPATLNAADQQTRRCVLARFAKPDVEQPSDASLPAEVAALLRTYRAYWNDAQFHKKTLAAADAALLDALRTQLAMPDADSDQISDAIEQRIRDAGLHVLVGGRTPPLIELMIWRSETKMRVKVALPEGVVKVPVRLLDGFDSLGWASWASCDQQGTGGWTTKTDIMVVRPSWKLDSEDYKVSLLGHEAQHFSDKTRYPKLEAGDLEFRAKLVELILARQTGANLLTKFARSPQRDRSLPHPFANFWVLERLQQRLHTNHLSRQSLTRIRAAARAELKRHTRELARAGGRAARTALPD